jgi:TetR/AcrR family transcriptional regulator
MTALERFINHMVETSLADPRYQRLLLDVNWYGGRHLDQMANPAVLPSRRIAILGQIIENGVHTGIFRSGVDPLQLYISILGIFSIRTTNAHSLSRTLGADLLTESGRAQSHAHAISLLLDGLRARP